MVLYSKPLHEMTSRLELFSLYPIHVLPWR